MRTSFFFLIGILILNNAFAQKNNQATGYAFSTLIQPGTLQVDENGNPVKAKINKERFVYLLMPGKNRPMIKIMTYNGIRVKWSMLTVPEREYAYIAESTQKSLSIKPLKFGTMWRINIQEFANHPIQTKATPIILKGIAGTKPFIMTILNEIAVQGFDSY